MLQPSQIDRLVRAVSLVGISGQPCPHLDTGDMLVLTIDARQSAAIGVRARSDPSEQATLARSMPNDCEPCLRLAELVDNGDMAIPLEELSWLLSNSSNVVVQVDANDPRSCPTEALLVVANSQATLAELEQLPDQLSEECGWGLGYEVGLSKRAGGIGADGLTLVGLVLGVVGAVPTVESIFRKIGRRAPTMPDRESALQTATWAVSMQYRGVPRGGLRVVREERHQDHWTLTMTLDASGDTFEVDVYGMPRSGAVATRVVWQDGDPWGRNPGEAGTGQ